MSESNHLFHDILADPDSDVPRLVYADWLEEHGDHDRAEFIRVQCELARTADDSPRRARLRAREQHLLREYQVMWKRQLPDLEEALWEAFDRGFVGTVRFESVDAFTFQADRVFAAAPIREVRLHRMYQDGARKLARSAHLGRVRVLDLEDGNAIGNPGLEALAVSPFIAGLTTLKLRSNAVGPAGVRALVNSPHLGSLGDLGLDANALYDEGVQAIAASSRLRHLGRLSLGWTRCGDAGVEALARSPHLANLRWLYLSGNQITDAGMTALSQSPHLTGLRDLYLEANQIGDEGVRAAAESPTLAGLAALYLKSNRVGDAGARALLESSYLQHIEELVLVENRISPDLTQALRQRFGRRVWSW